MFNLRKAGHLRLKLCVLLSPFKPTQKTGKWQKALIKLEKQHIDPTMGCPTGAAVQSILQLGLTDIKVYMCRATAHRAVRTHSKSHSTAWVSLSPHPQKQKHPTSTRNPIPGIQLEVCAVISQTHPTWHSRPRPVTSTCAAQ